MSYPIKSYAAHSPTGRLGLFEFERHSARPDDVVIEILYCGVCHSDLHNVRNDWGNATYPMVPGHEIVGRVVEVGTEVTRTSRPATASAWAAWSTRAATAAPLLCAGITTWSPLRHWQVGPGSKVAIVGLGGLGHMGG